MNKPKRPNSEIDVTGVPAELLIYLFDLEDYCDYLDDEVEILDKECQYLDNIISDLME